MSAQNVRFWVYCFSGWVKLTLKPGQVLRWRNSFYREEWEHLGHWVRDTYSTYATCHSMSCPVPVVWARSTDSPDGRIPDWRTEGRVR